MCRVFNPRDTTYVMSREGMIWEADHCVHFIIDAPYARQIALVHRHWAGKHRRVVNGINLVSLVWSDGPHAILCDYRLFDVPNDGMTKNDHFRAMLQTAKDRGCTPQYVCFDGWL